MQRVREKSVVLLLWASENKSCGFRSPVCAGGSCVSSSLCPVTRGGGVGRVLQPVSW